MHDKDRKLILEPKPVLFETEPILLTKQTSINLIQTFMHHIYNSYRMRIGDDRPSPMNEKMKGVLYGSDTIRMLAEIDFSRYKTVHGMKVTKLLRPILTHIGLDKQGIAFGWDKLCTYVADMYTPETQILAYFGDKAKLGEGDYEGGSTCFRDEGENAHNKFWLASNRRAQAFVMQRVPEDMRGINEDELIDELVRNQLKYQQHGVGRCIVWFHGGRRVSMFNHYVYGTRMTDEMFADGVKRIFNWHDAVFHKEHSYIDRVDVYTNNRPHLLNDARSNENRATRIRFRCTCGNLHYRSGMWCSDTCYRECRADHNECHECGGDADDEFNVCGEYYHMCQPCFEDRTSYCNRCDETFWAGDVRRISTGDYYCESCLDNECIKCVQCEEYVKLDDSYRVEDDSMCRPCWENHSVICEVCNESFFSDNVNEHGRCTSCQEEVDEENSEAVA